MKTWCWRHQGIKPEVPEPEVSEALEVYQGEMFLSCYGELGENWF